MRGSCSESARVCVYEILDGDGDGASPPICGGRDCNDDASWVYPGAVEYCNGRDDDCDGTVDEDSDASCGAGLSCRDGECGCDDPMLERCDTFPGFECVDLSSDEGACGECFRSCAPGSTCVDGECRCADAGLLDCYGECVDPRSDWDHCGGCNRGCWADQICAASTCTACGGRGQPCCEGDTCDSSLDACVEGTCELRACAAPYDPIPPDLLPRCAAETLSCYDTCSDSACLQACIDTDPTPPVGRLDCNECLGVQRLACAWMAGCDDEIAAFECCIEDRCPTDPRCTACATQRNAAQSCMTAARCYIDSGLALDCYAPSAP